jgi:hypothetical protein
MPSISSSSSKTINFLLGVAKGKTVMAVYSYSMIVLSFYAVMTESPLDGSIAGMYGIAVGFYSYSKVKRDEKGNQ